MNRSCSLYLIACSSKKNSGGNFPAWEKVRNQIAHNRFPSLDANREEMIKYYSTLQEPNKVYKRSKKKKKENAWRKNQGITKCRTTEAILRYEGILYSQLDKKINENLMEGWITNLLILSALMGIVHPLDKIPDYDLRMVDKSPAGNKVLEYWSNGFASNDFKHAFKEHNPELEYIYCFMGQDYIDAIRPMLLDFKTYRVVTNKKFPTPINRLWAQGLNLCLTKAETPQEVIDLLSKLNCDLEPLS